jgi:hypothetical protein
MRVTMYLLSVLAQDEETQRKGCVGIFMNVHPFRRPVELAFNLTNLMTNIGPMRYEAIHFCVDEQSMPPNLESVVSSVHQPTRCARIRFHSGTLQGIWICALLGLRFYFNIDLLFHGLLCRCIT